MSKEPIRLKSCGLFFIKNNKRFKVKDKNGKEKHKYCRNLKKYGSASSALDITAIINLIRNAFNDD